MRTYRSLLIHSSFEGHLVASTSWLPSAVLPGTRAYKYLLEFLLGRSFVSVYPEVESLDQTVNSIFNLLMNRHTISGHRLLATGGSSDTTHPCLERGRGSPATDPSSCLPGDSGARPRSEMGFSVSASGTFAGSYGHTSRRHGNSVDGDTGARRGGVP